MASRVTAYFKREPVLSDTTEEYAQHHKDVRDVCRKINLEPKQMKGFPKRWSSLDEFQKVLLIGAGANGKVYRAYYQDPETKKCTVHAIKVFNTNQVSNLFSTSSFVYSTLSYSKTLPRW